MRGTILGYDSTEDRGVINDVAGERVSFARAEWKGADLPAPGTAVDFESFDGRAIDIYPLPVQSVEAAAERPANGAMIWGSISLTCAILSLILGPIGIITLVVAIVFGIKGKNEGRDLEDRTGYYLSIGGLAISLIALLVVAFALAAFLTVFASTAGYFALTR